MLKSVFITLILLICTAVSAQQPKKKPPMQCDTIAAGSRICIPNAVFFTYTSVYGNIVIQQMDIHGGCAGDMMARHKPGTVVLCENIVISPKPGMLVRIPPRKFYLQ